MKGDNTMDKRIMSYEHHVIWYGDGFFSFAKGDGTDYYCETLEEAMEKIDKIEENKKQRR